ncbi:hypothetical protein AMR71_03555 [Bacillus altitudinis]|nr:hypothetical protein AKO65_07240 [Bacillus altitudinis]ALM44358.1 hypothetical protein AMR71_03555 [Bacillus altitudinis]ANY95833.1 hypothetical protein AKO66_03555 [Bacillus altitudinis]
MLDQVLDVNLSIPIPADKILISKVELQNLREQSLSGVYWNMKDLEKKTSRKSEWIKEKILYPSRFRKILDSENGGFVFYPKSKGQNWSFHAAKTAAFLDKHFTEIFNGQ